jgi:hypothetical protein
MLLHKLVRCLIRSRQLIVFGEDTLIKSRRLRQWWRCRHWGMFQMHLSLHRFIYPHKCRTQLHQRQLFQWRMRL